MKCLQIAAQRGKEGSDIGAFYCSSATTRYSLKFNFRTHYTQKMRNFAVMDGRWRFLFFRSLSVSASPESCLCFCSIWILCRCEKVPRERRAAVLFAQQLSPPRRAIFQALPLAQKQSAKNRNFLFHYLLHFFLAPSCPHERKRQDKPGRLMDTHTRTRMENTIRFQHIASYRIYLLLNAIEVTIFQLATALWAFLIKL
jgi:hypothetical protein